MNRTVVTIRDTVSKQLDIRTFNFNSFEEFFSMMHDISEELKANPDLKVIGVITK